jgi:hypothetical protein
MYVNPRLIPIAPNIMMAVPKENPINTSDMRLKSDNQTENEVNAQ